MGGISERPAPHAGIGAKDGEEFNLSHKREREDDVARDP